MKHVVICIIIITHANSGYAGGVLSRFGNITEKQEALVEKRGAIREEGNQITLNQAQQELRGYLNNLIITRYTLSQLNIVKNSQFQTYLEKILSDTLHSKEKLPLFNQYIEQGCQDQIEQVMFNLWVRKVVTEFARIKAAECGLSNDQEIK